MSGLSRKDLDILSKYALEGNRELYWNYLSQLPGADGYGTLALGVVRNDSFPGRVANGYAQDYARTQHENGSRYPNRELSEREWDQFGRTLLAEDLRLRMLNFEKGRPDLALNLPGADVMLAHDRAFERNSLDPNCWTPRVLLQATLDKSGPARAEEVWRNMLDNEVVGVMRAGKTSLDALSEMGPDNGSRYLDKLKDLEISAGLMGLDGDRPNVIGSKQSFHVYSENDGRWYKNELSWRYTLKVERDPSVIETLNDTRALRLERQDMSRDFHAEDPYRRITPSPFTVSVDPPAEIQGPALRLEDIGPGDRDYALLGQAREAVYALDARAGREPDVFSERLIASSMVLARQNDLERADHVVLSAATAERGAGYHVFVVQGDLNDPSQRRACMETGIAVQTPVEDSLQRLHAVNQERDQVAAREQSLGLAQEEQRHGMRMG
ncbi:XVIPCD domain-containing protein [Stenotrophomonas sp. 278]|uniref:XVIPCD domain-containing protein n=1 Tax=Stenotrophomonas sp. 278 TaxID=2479851 RepID=UPI000F67237A|nr:XVIPCD domain-containing protein [Stenotrophomonas sp. 278]RRU14381.1 hemolysin [Stenotrophomonas sp. 278]